MCIPTSSAREGGRSKRCGDRLAGSRCTNFQIEHSSISGGVTGIDSATYVYGSVDVWSWGMRHWGVEVRVSRVPNSNEIWSWLYCVGSSCVHSPVKPVFWLHMPTFADLFHFFRCFFFFGVNYLGMHDFWWTNHGANTKWRNCWIHIERCDLLWRIPLHLPLDCPKQENMVAWQNDNRSAADRWRTMVSIAEFTGARQQTCSTGNICINKLNSDWPCTNSSGSLRSQTKPLVVMTLKIWSLSTTSPRRN